MHMKKVPFIILPAIISLLGLLAAPLPTDAAWHYINANGIIDRSTDHGSRDACLAFRATQGDQGTCIEETCGDNGGTCLSRTSCPSTMPSMSGTCREGDICCTSATGSGFDYGETGSNLGGLRTGESDTATAATGSTGSSARSGSFAYEALEAIPGSDRTGEISPYLQAIYRFGLWAVGIAALFMLSVGGMMYLTSAGNTSAVNTAKKVIFDAIIGLVLAIIAWLILYVINPQLIEANLDIFSSSSSHVTDNSNDTTSGTANGDEVGTNSTPTEADSELADQLLRYASRGGDCRDEDGDTVSPYSNLQETTNRESVTTCHRGCSSSNQCNRTTNLSSTLLQGLVDMSGSTTSFTITSLAGGSHSRNSQHYSGNAVDIDKPSTGVQSYVNANGTQVCNRVYRVTSSNNTTLYFYDENDHWHVQTSIGTLCGS